METKTSLWVPAEYSSSSQYHLKDADLLMRQILNDGVQNVKIIVDLGCGPGDATESFSKHIPHEKIVAVDIDPQMISYANINHKDETIEYFTQDIGLPWKNLNEKLKTLEGTVDIVVSNYVLHWVKDKENTVETISRLLKPGGRFYANMVLLRDPFEFSEGNQNRYKHLYHVKTPEKQIRFLQSGFEKKGVSLLCAEILENDWSYDSEEEYEHIMSGGANIWEILVRPYAMKQSEKETKKMIEVMRANTNIIHGHPFGHKNTIQPTNLLHFYFEQLRMVGRKI